MCVKHKTGIRLYGTPFFINAYESDQDYPGAKPKNLSTITHV